MKNKKFIARALALFATVVLMVALAVPCFADAAIDDALTSFNGSLSSDAYNPAYLDLVDGMGSTFFDADTLISGHLVGVGDRFYLSSANYGTYQLHGIVSVVADGVQLNPSLGGYIEVMFYDEYVSFAFVDDSDEVYLCLDCSYNYQDNSVIVDDVQGNVAVNNVYVAFAGGNDSLSALGFVSPALHGEGYDNVVYYPRAFLNGYGSNADGSTVTTRSGLFGKLYYILRDAIYGQNVVLDNAQDFTLTQMATWLTYAVVLVPIIFAVVVTVKMFRW